MTNELKLRTLKDIDSIQFTDDRIINPIRAEAIKRAKKYKEEILTEGNSQMRFGFYSGKLAEVVEFNNLNDEDLQ